MIKRLRGFDTLGGAVDELETLENGEARLDFFAAIINRLGLVLEDLRKRSAAAPQSDERELVTDCLRKAGVLLECAQQELEYAAEQEFEDARLEAAAAEFEKRNPREVPARATIAAVPVPDQPPENCAGDAEGPDLELPGGDS